jgi:hypothetical protein
MNPFLTLAPNPQSFASSREQKFTPKGAREDIAQQFLPAPFGGRMSEVQIGGCFKYGLMQKVHI